MSEAVLYRIDPATNETIGSVRYAAAGNPRSGVEDPVAVGGGSVWVASARDDRLVKIDPERMRVVWKRHVPSLWAVAYAGSSVWVAQLDSNLVARVDPETGRVKTRATAVGPTDLAPGPGRIWALEHRGSALLGLSTRTGKKAAQVSFEARAPERLAIGSGAAWISDTLGWLVVRVNTSAPNKTRPILMPGGGETMPGNMAAGGGHVWVATIQSHVLRIDPLRNRVDAGAQINAAPKCAQPRTGCVLDVAYGEGSVWVGDTHARTVVRLSAAP